MEAKHYGRLALMSVLHFGAMFVLMYAMVDAVGNALPNVNQVYMAGLMPSHDPCSLRASAVQLCGYEAREAWRR
ncbi:MULTISPECIES: hypothetical protein [unclassified Phenylobacterium]|uniref:hypothetical protein n=1 Tax=unclassified Phenylobacterium TaxID=2640670 RepID=UPI000A6E1F1F|nr:MULTISPECIES: hypothetical protein [unclassified Phenylobacterium]